MGKLYIVNWDLDLGVFGFLSPIDQGGIKGEGTVSPPGPTKKTSQLSHSKFEILNYPTRAHSTEHSTQSTAQLQEFQQTGIIRCQSEVDSKR